MDLLCEQHDQVFHLTLNRPHKHNAFNASLLADMQTALDDAIADPSIEIILLNALGSNFSAGADVTWMKQMAQFSEEENRQDALVLAKLMATLHHCPKPTICKVQGAALGGGAGLVAACDIAIAALNASFCFSEVKLGLIPAVISPYVIKAIGERAAKWLFISAETFHAPQAQTLGLIHYCVPKEELESFTQQFINRLKQLAPQAMKECKQLVKKIVNQPVTDEIIQQTAEWIAQKRVSAEGQYGLHCFLTQQTPHWKDAHV